MATNYRATIVVVVVVVVEYNKKIIVILFFIFANNKLSFILNSFSLVVLAAFSFLLFRSIFLELAFTNAHSLAELYKCFCVRAFIFSLFFLYYSLSLARTH